MTDAALVREKLDQAPAILEEQGIDLWLTLVRETLLTRDPCLDLIAGTYCAWQSAFLVSRSGERIAIVGRYDASSVEQLGAYSEVVKYDESIRPGLRETIERLAPETIAINYSPSDPAADGLTHGLWLVLSETLEGTPYADRLVSSKPIVGSLRGRKSPFEIARIRAAIAETEEIFAHVGDRIGPEMKETEIAAVMQAEVSRRGLGYAWEEDHCPAVDAGPEKEVGHSGPSELETQRGQLLHMDFGVEKDAYRSDLQRVWYLLDDGESEPPEDVLTRVARRLGLGGRGRCRAPARRGRARGRRRRPRKPRLCGLRGAEVCARPPARAALPTTGAPCSRRSGTGTATPRSAPSRRATSTPSSTERRSTAGAISGSRKTCSSPRTASSG